MGTTSYSTCAIVGNSGHLLKSKYGMCCTFRQRTKVMCVCSLQAYIQIRPYTPPWHTGWRIDQHEAVFRLNQAPTSGYERYVGSKTTARLLNRLWTIAFAGRHHNQKYNKAAAYVLRNGLHLISSRTNWKVGACNFTLAITVLFYRRFTVWSLYRISGISKDSCRQGGAV